MPNPGRLRWGQQNTVQIFLQLGQVKQHRAISSAGPRRSKVLERSQPKLDILGLFIFISGEFQLSTESNVWTQDSPIECQVIGHYEN